MRILRYIPEVLLLPFVLKRVGDEAYGIYVLAWSVLLSLSRIEGPITSTVVKFSASYIAINEENKLCQLVSTSFMLSLCFTFASTAIFIIIINLFPGIISTSNEQYAFYIIIIIIIFAFPMMPYVGIIYSFQRHDLFFIVDALTTILKAIAVILWFSLIEPSIIALIAINGISFILPRFLMVLQSYKIIPYIKNNTKNFNFDLLKSILSFAILLLLASLCYIINYTGVKWLMGFIVSLTFVAHLHIMLIPSKIISQFALSMTLTIMPVASKYSTLKANKKLGELLISGTRYIVLLLLPIIILSALMIRPILHLWVGQGYVFLAKYTFMLIIFGSTLYAAQCANQIMRGIGEAKRILFCSIISQAIIPIVTILTIYIYNRNPYWSVTIGLSMGFVAYFIMQTYFCTKILKVSNKDFFTRAYLQPLTIAIPIILFSKAIITYWHIINFALLTIISIVGITLFGTIFLMLFITHFEKDLIKEMINLLSKKRSFRMTKG